MVKDLTLRSASRARFNPVIPEKKAPNFRLNRKAFSFQGDNKWVKPEDLVLVKYCLNNGIGVEEMPLRGLPNILSRDSSTQRVSILFPEPQSMQGWNRDDVKEYGFEVTHLLYRNPVSELEEFLISEFGVPRESDKNEFSRNISNTGSYLLVPLLKVESSDKCNELLGVDKQLIYGNFKN